MSALRPFRTPQRTRSGHRSTSVRGQKETFTINRYLNFTGISVQFRQAIRLSRAFVFPKLVDIGADLDRFVG